MTEERWIRGNEVIMRLARERDELARQLDDARRLACHYAELLHQAHNSRVIIERDQRTR